jgi:hypothetical protein
MVGVLGWNKSKVSLSILIIVQRDATQSSLFIILQVHSACFRCQPHPSSVAHKTVTTASGNGPTSTHIFTALYLIKNKYNLLLCLWFRASLIYINNCPTRCNTKQSVYYSARSLYMFRVSTTPIVRSTQNCNYSLQLGQASLATLEGGSCTKKYDQYRRL